MLRPIVNQTFNYMLKMNKHLEKNNHLMYKKAGKYTLALYCALTLSACANFNEVVSGDKVDYKSGLQTTSNLEIPPTVARPNLAPTFAAPDTQSFSQFVKQREAQQSGGVLPTSTIARIEREGAKRWLVVNMPADEAWPKLEKFWNDLGFKLEVKDPATGIMETNWLENKAGAPNDGFRRLLSTIMSMAFSTDKKDKFRTRLERGANNETEIYITHSGVEEQYSDKKLEDTKYVARPQDPELEAEILSKMILALGMNQKQADYLKQNYLSTATDSKAKATVASTAAPTSSNMATNSNSSKYLNHPHHESLASAQNSEIMSNAAFEQKIAQSQNMQVNKANMGLLNTVNAANVSIENKTATATSHVGEQINLNSSNIATASRRLGMAIDSAAFKINAKSNDPQSPFWVVEYINPEQFNQQLGFWKRLKGQNVDELRKARQFKIMVAQNGQAYIAQVEPQTPAKNEEESKANIASQKAILGVLAEHLQVVAK